MEFIICDGRYYVWTGMGRSSDAIEVVPGHKYLILGEFRWDGMAAVVILHHSGAIAWTPMFNHIRRNF